MTTIKELKVKLKKRGLQVGGTKKELSDRLDKAVKNKLKKPQASVKYSPNITNPLNKFYISTHFQIPNSKMASSYIKSRGYTHK